MAYVHMSSLHLLLRLYNLFYYCNLHMYMYISNISTLYNQSVIHV